jgi:hypothetical protein
MLPLRCLAVLCGTLAAIILGPADAHACACCTNSGQRHEAVEPLGSDKLDEIGRLRFASQAQLFTGDADPDMIKGITARWAQFDLRVETKKDRWIFTFRDKDGQSGTLTLALPWSISVFAVDTRRGEREGGSGPTLYREWKLNAPAAGTGILAAGTGKGQRIALVLQGHGNSCASASDFTHWTLAVSGAAARYHLFGTLLPP